MLRLYACFSVFGYTFKIRDKNIFGNCYLSLARQLKAHQNHILICIVHIHPSIHPYPYHYLQTKTKITILVSITIGCAGRSAELPRCLWSEPRLNKTDGLVSNRAANDPLVFTIMEKAPTSAFTFKTLFRHYAKRALTHPWHGK